MTLALDVRLEASATPAGRLTRLDSGTVSFAYSPDYLALPNAPPISLALPRREEPFGDREARAYFANLLPEDDRLDHVMDREGIDRGDIVGLLYHLGADTAGAVSCVPEGAPAAKIPGSLLSDYDPLSPELAAEFAIRLADRRPLPDEARDPSPLAGVQRKIALAVLPDGRFAMPKQGLNVPTTHILKVPRRAEARDADLEAAALRLAKTCGLAAAVPAVLDFGDVRGLLSARFDRRIDANGNVTRIHQEDFAQALGLPPSLKYERRGAPPRVFDLRAIRKVLGACATPAVATRTFLMATFFNLLIGNTDNHAKNHALLYDRGPAPNLAPLYDLMPIRLDDRYTHQLAFHIGKSEFPDRLTADDYASLFAAFGLSARAAKRFAQSEVAMLIVLLHDAAQTQLRGLKTFADFIAGETIRLSAILELHLPLKPRDYFAPKAGGWTSS